MQTKLQVLNLHIPLMIKALLRVPSNSDLTKPRSCLEPQLQSHGGNGAENPKILKENHRILEENDKILEENHGVLAENPKILEENHRILAENHKILHCFGMEGTLNHLLPPNRVLTNKTKHQKAFFYFLNFPSCKF